VIFRTHQTPKNAFGEKNIFQKNDFPKTILRRNKRSIIEITLINFVFFPLF
jgi:hypothetical protein